MLDNVNKILIVRLSAIGDVVMTLPCVYALRKRFPDAKIYYATQPPCDEIVKASPYLDGVIPLNFPGWKKRWFLPSVWLDVVRQLQNISRLQFDAAVNLHIMVRAAFVAFAAAPVRVGHDTARELNRWFMNVRVSPHAGCVHQVEQFLRVLEPFGINDSCMDFSLKIPDEEAEEVNKFIERFKLNNGFVAVCPCASRPEKTWSPHKWGSLCDRIIRDTGLPVVLMGAEGEKASLEFIMENTQNARRSVVLAAGVFNLRQVVYVLSRGAFFLGVDSAPAHLAVCAKARGCVVWTKTNPLPPECFAPVHKSIRVLRETDATEIHPQDVLKVLRGPVPA